MLTIHEKNVLVGIKSDHSRRWTQTTDAADRNVFHTEVFCRVNFYPLYYAAVRPACAPHIYRIEFIRSKLNTFPPEKDIIIPYPVEVTKEAQNAPDQES